MAGMKGNKTHECGGQFFNIRCDCGWSTVGSKRTTDMALRLHKQKCKTALGQYIKFQRQIAG